MAHSSPGRQRHGVSRRHLSLDRIHRIRQWHLGHRQTNPLEYHLLDAVLTCWMMGWIGWLPAFALGQSWAYPLCIVGICTPAVYVRLRSRAHHSGRLRCGWIEEA